jgi:hypothetical protein
LIVFLDSQERPGAHNTPSRPINVSAFSLSKRTGITDPHRYLKKGTGLGGTLVRQHNIKTPLLNHNYGRKQEEG